MKYTIVTPLSLAKDIIRFHERELAERPDATRRELYGCILTREFSENFDKSEIKAMLCKCDNLAELTVAVFLYERRLSKEQRRYRGAVINMVLEYFRQYAHEEYIRAQKRERFLSASCKRSGNA